MRILLQFSLDLVFQLAILRIGLLIDMRRILRLLLTRILSCYIVLSGRLLAVDLSRCHSQADYAQEQNPAKKYFHHCSNLQLQGI